MKKVLFLAAAVATLFASCSKDATEDVATVQTGDAAFYASMSFEADATTRHHINENNEYEWEAGDMVGISNGVSTIPFVTVQGGVNAAFQAVQSDLDYLGDVPYFMVYPYTSADQVTANANATAGTITVRGLEVPSVQRYRPNSFSTMTAPAFAYVEEFENNSQVEFQAAASMIEVSFVGKGAIQKLTMVSKSGYQLSGSFDAVLSENKDGETVVEYTAANGDNKVAVDFGKSPLNLNYNEETPNVVFVVAPGELPDGDKFFISVDFVDENQEDEVITLNIPENTTFEPNKLYSVSEAKVVGLKGYTLITNEVEFITYANFNSSLNTKALVISDLDFETFDAEAAYAEIGAIVNKTEIEKYRYNALKWYIDNEYTIAPLANNAIVGGNAEPSVINGLVVVGNGISNGVGLENIKFTNSVVVANTENAGFLAADAHAVSIKNVVIGEGNVLNASAATGYIGGIVGRLFTDSSKLNNVEVVELPTIINTLSAEAGTQYIGEAYGYVNAAANYVIDMEAIKASSLSPVVGVVAAADNNVIEIKNAAADYAYENAFVAQASNPASIVINGVSYWNGVKAAVVNTDAYYTAEELAYVLNAGNSANITLTHNIDMQCVDTEEESQVVTLTHYQSSAFNVNTTYTGTGDNKVYNVFEIKNLIGKTVDARVATLFGYTANVSNVTLSNVTIETGYNANYIAGLAHTGTAQNVVINDLTINVGKAHNEAATIGGVFGTAVYNSVKNVTVNSCAINYEGTAKSNVGIIAGTLTINPDATETLEGVKISSNKNDFSVSKNFGEWWTKGAELANFKASASYAGRYPFGVVTVANAQFATAGNVKAYLAAKDCQSWSSRIAAGLVFSNTLTDAAAAKVEFDAAKEYKYAFYLNDGLTIGNNNYSVFGFSKK